MSKKILVIGGTGKTGSRVFSRLQEKGVAVFPASRNSATIFDWYNTETWSAALSGKESVYITFQPDLAVPQSPGIISAFVRAAKREGIRKLVLLSGRGEPEAEACEKIIISSGLNWTILRASFFMQNFSEGFWADGIASREFVIPVIKAREPFVDTNDIADVAVEALLEDKHHGRTYELTGPELLSFKDTTAKIAAGLQTDIKLTEVPLDEYTRMLETFQVPSGVIWLIRYLFTEVLDGRNESISGDIEEILQRRPASFDNFVRDVIQAKGWSVE